MPNKKIIYVTEGYLLNTGVCAARDHRRMSDIMGLVLDYMDRHDTTYHFQRKGVIVTATKELDAAAVYRRGYNILVTAQARDKTAIKNLLEDIVDATNLNLINIPIKLEVYAKMLARMHLRDVIHRQFLRGDISS